MAEAWWNDTLIARSDDIVTVEGNAYFPHAAVVDGVLKDSATTSSCPWKGTAHYYSLVAGGAENHDAAWYYPEPKRLRRRSRDAWRSGRAWRCGEPDRRISGHLFGRGAGEGHKGHRSAGVSRRRVTFASPRAAARALV